MRRQSRTAREKKERKSPDIFLLPHLSVWSPFSPSWPPVASGTQRSQNLKRLKKAKYCEFSDFELISCVTGCSESQGVIKNTHKYMKAIFIRASCVLKDTQTDFSVLLSTRTFFELQTWKPRMFSHFIQLLQWGQQDSPKDSWQMESLFSWVCLEDFSCLDRPKAPTEIEIETPDHLFLIQGGRGSSPHGAEEDSHGHWLGWENRLSQN